MITAEELSRFPDTFNGDDAHLVRCIEALLSLDATGTLVPHGIGGHARGLLSAGNCIAAMSRMKDAAMVAHKLCYEAMLKHPDVETLGDDGELHKAIHAIVGVDTNAYEARSPEPAGRDAVAYTDPENLADGSDPNSWELYRPGDQAKGDVALYASAPALDSEELVNLIRNDAYAITFQSMGQYRSALLRRLAGAPNHGQ